MTTQKTKLPLLQKLMPDFDEYFDSNYEAEREAEEERNSSHAYDNMI